MVTCAARHVTSYQKERILFRSHNNTPYIVDGRYHKPVLKHAYNLTDGEYQPVLHYSIKLAPVKALKQEL